jgi:large subunit ribosomal protein L21e|tara:strand:+ start:109 stop:447 length:339 start_codon:yes stop_codon:yes gene_type:complete
VEILSKLEEEVKMNRKGGPRRKTRNKLKVPTKSKGKISIRKILKTFKIGDKVQLVADGSVQGGMFPLRFYGKNGVIKAKQGRSYLVDMNDRTKKKTFIVRPVHLKRTKVNKK